MSWKFPGKYKYFLIQNDSVHSYRYNYTKNVNDDKSKFQNISQNIFFVCSIQFIMLLCIKGIPPHARNVNS